MGSQLLLQTLLMWKRALNGFSVLPCILSVLLTLVPCQVDCNLLVLSSAVDWCTVFPRLVPCLVKDLNKTFTSLPQTSIMWTCIPSQKTLIQRRITADGKKASLGYILTFLYYSLAGLWRGEASWTSQQVHLFRTKIPFLVNFSLFCSRFFLGGRFCLIVCLLVGLGVCLVFLCVFVYLFWCLFSFVFLLPLPFVSKFSWGAENSSSWSPFHRRWKSIPSYGHGTVSH